MGEETPVSKEEVPVSEQIPANEQPRRAEQAAPRVRYVERKRGYRSLFWPMVLIGLGVLWLLSNLGIISAENWSVLAKLWPLVLIAIGLDLLVGRLSPVLGGLMGLAMVGLVVVLVVIGPAMGWASETTIFGMPVELGGSLDVKHGRFSTPLNDAESADVSLDLSFEQTSISALPAGSDNLLEAEMDYVGDVILDASGGRSRSVVLRQEYMAVGDFNLPPLGQSMRWDIGLSPDVPLDLAVDVASGSADLDLSAIQLTGLDVEGGSGSTRLELPAMPDDYMANIDVASGSFNVAVPRDALVEMDVAGGSGSFTLDVGAGAAVSVDADVSSGSFTVEVGDGANLDLSFDGGSGSLNVRLPAGAALRVEVREGGSGSVNLPGGLVMVDDGGDDERDTGIWQTEGFEQAEKRVTITARDIESGSLNVR